MNERAARVRVVSPISVPEEIDGLAASGAEEFYCGIAPESWTRRYGDGGWLNRRGAGKANLTSVADLAILVRHARARGIGVSVPLNSPYYTADQLPALLDLCRELADAGAAGLIVSDPGLILALRQSDVTLPITASSVAAIRNSSACAFYRDLGVTRIILPRHIGIADVERIRDRTPDVELEVFILNDGCAYEEGFCATTHAAGAFCMTEWNYAFARVDGAPLSEEERGMLGRNVDDYRNWIWHIANCGRALSARRLPNGPCGLCAIWDFHRIGIDCLKIVGREAHPIRKLRSVQLVHAAVEMARRGCSKDEIRAFAREVRGTPELCDPGYMCYYREARVEGT